MIIVENATEEVQCKFMVIIMVLFMGGNISYVYLLCYDVVSFIIT